MPYSDLNPEKISVREQVELKPYNTLGLSSKAGLFVEITDPAQLTELYKMDFFTEDLFVLGGGSNILLKNRVSKPVLKISIPGIEVISESEENVSVKAGAGVNWHNLVEWAVENNYGGIENLALIPGTAGASPIQNIGAYGVELQDVFVSLNAFLPDKGEFRDFEKEECRFGYRDSIFKRDLKEKVVITDITLRLSKPPHKIEDSYYAIQNYFEEHGIDKADIADIFKAVVEIRTSKLPDPKLIGNAGSFFKNPIIDEQLFMSLKRDYPDLPSFAVDEHQVKVPAGWLIEKAGWKGKRVGNVGTYQNQALVIVNHGNASGEEIYTHAMRIRESVKSMFGIELVPEVNIIE
jgi:UDP-N-acetylmuramate dehydrogenase